MIGKFTGNNTCACGFSIGFERIIMLLMERGFQVPQIGTKKALLIEKNMPAEGDDESSETGQKKTGKTDLLLRLRL